MKEINLENLTTEQLEKLLELKKQAISETKTKAKAKEEIFGTKKKFGHVKHTIYFFINDRPVTKLGHIMDCGARYLMERIISISFAFIKDRSYLFEHHIDDEKYWNIEFNTETRSFELMEGDKFISSQLINSKEIAEVTLDFLNTHSETIKGLLGIK